MSDGLDRQLVLEYFQQVGAELSQQLEMTPEETGVLVETLRDNYELLGGNGGAYRNAEIIAASFCLTRRGCELIRDFIHLANAAVNPELGIGHTAVDDGAAQFFMRARESLGDHPDVESFVDRWEVNYARITQQEITIS